MKIVCPDPNIMNVEISHDVFGPLSEPMKAMPVNLKLRENYVPYHINAPRKIPIPMQKGVSEEIQWMLDNNIIREVKEPTEWCAPISVPIKKNGQIRICVDLRQLNKHLVRPKFPLPTFNEIASKLAKSCFYTKLDASRGYWQLPLSPECQELTTFITHQGRYCFTRLPFGINVASEEF
jgi:hypothetical protein